MAREDICYLKNTTNPVLMPLVVTGKCSGVATLMQKVTILMITNQSDPTRNYGGSLGALLMGTNLQSEEIAKNYFQQAAVEVYTLLQEEYNLELHDLPDDEILTGLNVDSVEITAPDAVSVRFEIENLAGDTDYFNINIPINTGE